MQRSQIPTKIPLPWAASAGGGYINFIPTPSQIGIVNGRASFTDGFVPLNFVPVAAGGVPPFGGDFNGLNFQVTGGLQWLQAGGLALYDPTFSSAIGGYPAGSVLLSALYNNLWVSLVDNNTSNPDTGGANWAPLIRQRLSAGLNLYVNGASGNDANTGLTSMTPWATLTKAAAYISTVDTGGFPIALNVQPGLYTAGFLLTSSIIGGGSVNILGNAGNPDLTLIEVTTGGPCVQIIGGGTLNVVGVNLIANGSGTSRFGISAGRGGQINFSDIDFGVCNDSQIEAFDGGVANTVNFGSGHYTITGGSNVAHFFADVGGEVNVSGASATSISSGLVFGQGFAYSKYSGLIAAASWSYGGASGITGFRYFAQQGGNIATNGGGANFFPGSAPGVTTGAGYT
jgi:hypothetical protein